MRVEREVNAKCESCARGGARINFSRSPLERDLGLPLLFRTTQKHAPILQAKSEFSLKNLICFKHRFSSRTFKSPAFSVFLLITHEDIV